MNKVYWEYKLLVVKTHRNSETGLPDDLNDRFNDLGAEGWELAKMEAIQKIGFWNTNSYTDSILVTFKRPKINTP